MKHVGMMVLVPPERQENNTCPVFVIDREAGVSVVEKKRNRRESTEKVIQTYRGGARTVCVLAVAVGSAAVLVDRGHKIEAAYEVRCQGNMERHDVGIFEI